MNVFIGGIKWQKRYDPLKMISLRYCNRLHKDQHSSQIKTEINGVQRLLSGASIKTS
jgi:hypothetical protein